MKTNIAMKNSVVFIVVPALLIFLSPDARSQEIKVDVKGKVIEETDQRANQKTEEAIDYGFDKIEEGVAGIFKKKEKKDKVKVKDEAEAVGPEAEASTVAQQSQATLKWNKYDFIPGEKIIFEDNQEGEENGEFPSRWDLAGGGSVENASFGDQNVIYFKEASSCIVPFFKEPANDNLPDLFTVEFDCWFEPEEYCQYLVSFYDHKNQSESSIEIDPLIINANHAGINDVGEGYYPGFEEKGEITGGFWRHVAVSFNTRALKVYLDDARVVNIPNIGINPEGLTICCDRMNSAGAQGLNRLIKNVRIAEGAVKLYDKLMQDGKIVANGIRFDVNKATIKPGVDGSNKIQSTDWSKITLKLTLVSRDILTAMAMMLQIKVSLSGVQRPWLHHLVSMGIQAGRLISKGWGETEPVGPNIPLKARQPTGGSICK